MNNNNEELNKYLVILDPDTGELVDIMDDDPLHDPEVFVDFEEDEGVYHIMAPNHEEAVATAQHIDSGGRGDPNVS